ncbi:MAG: hypothetical protein JNL90_14980 [Planctomycetes bacterium]|nr:hypothetical protein [Planctomycetota bacterium]
MARDPSGAASRRRPQRVREAGVGLIDSLVAIVVVSISSLGFLSATVSSRTLERENRTVAAANELARRVVEEMLAVPVADLVKSYNDDPADDPAGAGTARGDLFELRTGEDLVKREDPEQDPVPALMTCRIELPLGTDAGGNTVLREDLLQAELGDRADLNGDGVIDGVDRGGDYRILPVTINIAWPTPDGGTRTLRFATVVGGAQP